MCYLALKISEHELSMHSASVHDDIWGRETICRELFGENSIFRYFSAKEPCLSALKKFKIVCERPFSFMLSREK